jgi:hypothetical protein
MSIIPILVISTNDEPILDIYKRIKMQCNNPRVKFYFMYSTKNPTHIIDNDAYIQVEESVKKGCTVKTLTMMKLFRDSDFIVRTNLTNILNIDNLLYAIDKLPTDIPILSGYICNNSFAAGSLMIWNRLGIDKLLEMENIISNSGYPYNDDILLSMASRQNGVQFDNSMLSGIVETNYNFFYNPPKQLNWIMVKRPRNEFTTRYYSDLWSFREYINFPVSIDIYKMAIDMLIAIRFMDRSGQNEYISQNIDILYEHWEFLNHKYDGEYIYYILKYSKNRNIYITQICNSLHYIPDVEYVDLYFYYGIVKGLISKDIYKMLKVTTGTWRDKF